MSAAMQEGPGCGTRPLTTRINSTLKIYRRDKFSLFKAREVPDESVTGPRQGSYSALTVPLSLVIGLLHSEIHKVPHVLSFRQAVAGSGVGRVAEKTKEWSSNALIANINL